jgi:hypothetical protein
MSGGVLTEVGTMIRIGRDGYDCASARRGAASTLIAANSKAI